MLEAGIAAAVGDRLVDAVGGGLLAEQLAPIGAEARDGWGVEGELGDGVEDEAGELVGGALGGGVEASDVLDLVAEQVEADGLALAGRIDVDDAAADGELARLADGLGAVVAAADEEFGQQLGVERAALLDVEAGVAEGAPRRDALEDGVGGGENDAGFRGGLDQSGEGGGAFGDEGGVGRDAVVGQAVPGREPDDLDRGIEEGNGVREPGETGVVARDMQQRARMFGAAAREEARVVALGGAVDGGAEAGAALGAGLVDDGAQDS